MQWGLCNAACTTAVKPFRYLAMRLLNNEAFRSDTKWIVCIANGRHTA